MPRWDKVREAVAKELTPTLKPQGRPKKDEDKEASKPVAQQVYGTTNTEYIRSRLKDQAVRTAAGWLVDPEDVERYEKVGLALS